MISHISRIDKILNIIKVNRGVRERRNGELLMPLFGVTNNVYREL